MSQDHFKALDEWAAKNPPSKNPMVNRFGRDPYNRKCAECSILVQVDHGSKSFYKCKLRGITRGAGTDHRLSWDACSRIEALDGEE